MNVSLSAATYSVSEGEGLCNVSLELNEAAEREVTVFIQTVDGTATGSLGKWLNWWCVSCASLLFHSSSQ